MGASEQNWLAEAIAAAKTHQAAGFEALIGAYGPRLYGFFLRATGRHHDAEDLLGELTLRLLSRLKDYDHRGRFEPWLFRMAANLVRDYFRRLQRRQGGVSLSLEDELGRPLAQRLVDEDGGAEERLIAQEAGRELSKALWRLDIVTREVILLRHFGQMSFKEIAEMTDSPLGTVLARAHRGLGELRRLMGRSDAAE